MRKRKTSGLVLGVGVLCSLVGFAAGWGVGSVSVAIGASASGPSAQGARAQADGAAANESEKGKDGSLDPERLTALMKDIGTSGAAHGDDSLLKLDPSVLNTAIRKAAPASTVDGRLEQTGLAGA